MGRVLVQTVVECDVKLSNRRAVDDGIGERGETPKRENTDDESDREMSREIAVSGPPLSQLAPECACANGERSRMSAMPPRAAYRCGRDEPEQRENNDSCDLWTACSDRNRAAPALSWCRSGDRICRTGAYDIDRSISPSRMHRARRLRECTARDPFIHGAQRHDAPRDDVQHPRRPR